VLHVELIEAEALCAVRAHVAISCDQHFLRERRLVIEVTDDEVLALDRDDRARADHRLQARGALRAAAKHELGVSRMKLLGAARFEPATAGIAA